MTVRSPETPGYDGSEIAVVGMAGRFPGAPDVEAFWRNLREGVESITSFSDEELREAGVEAKLLEDPNYVRARPTLDGVELFDAAFFGFTPREAEVLDPQLRLFLECAWTALEHAGHDPSRLEGRASLFAGSSFSSYLVHNLYKNRPLMEAFGDMEATILNVQDSLVTMVGYKLNLKGACCAVQAFCSTSLVGVHLACQNLLNYESDLALAGGVSVYVPQKSGYLYREGSMVSRDGHCRSFDARADGTIFGSGVGIVVLRRLEDAVKDGDTVHAVIRGSALNNDGALKVSFAAPGVVGQTEVVVEALAAAGVDPETIGYVEAHGTGTRLGDPAEVSALTKAFRTRTQKTGFCAIGSVKTNVGHLDAAGGVAGLMKVILSLQHGQIPASLHFETPNPAIDFEASPFFVNTALREWPPRDGPRRAGVGTFGVGGTNAHVIVEEAPESRSEPSTRSHQLLVVSGKTPEALDAATRQLGAHLAANPRLELADVAWTLQVGRSAFAHRRVLVSASTAEAAARLAGSPESLDTGHPERMQPPVVLLLSGGESVAVGAWRELHGHQPAFRAAFERSVHATGDMGRAVERALYPGRDSAPGWGDPSLAPLAVFALEYALAQLLKAWGVRFEAVAGDGVGTLVAAALGQILDFERAARLAARRGRPAAFPDARPFEGRAGAEALAALPGDPGRLVVEAGGGSIGLRSVGKASGVASSDTGDAAAALVLGRLWLAGVNVDWAAVHAPERRVRVSLPTYPFERQRFWVEPVEEAGKVEERDPSEWIYRPVWKTAAPPQGRPDVPGARWLLLSGPSELGSRLGEHLRAAGAEVVTVEAGAVFRGDPAAGYTLDPADPGHYASLWADLGGRRKLPERVLHLWSAEALAGPSAADRFVRASELGFYSLLHLMAARPEGPLAVTVVSAGLHEVIGREALAPERAPVIALCRVLEQEQHDLRCRSIDVDPTDPRDEVVDGLLADLAFEGGDPLVAHRRGRRWVQEFERVSPTEQWAGSRVREGGVYLITGGLGEVGFVLGLALARQARAKLVLVGRRDLPPRDRWVEWLATHDALEETSFRIRRVQALEMLGAEVLVHSADVANVTEMREAVEAARQRFGALNGVIHAAGQLSADTLRPVRDLGRDACELQFLPKVHGLFALAEALKDQRADFVLLTSSLASILGGLGYAAYAGANAFMDAFAVSQNRRKREAWLSVDWDQWELGRRAGSLVPRPAGAEGSGLKPEEGMAVFERVLRLRGLDRVVVSTGSLADRIERWVRLSIAPQAALPPLAARPRPVLEAPYMAPVSERQGTLAALWQELLGIEKIGIHDNFFDLGGHSLFAARMLSRLRAAFGVMLSLEAVFEAPTVAALASRVDAALLAQEGPVTIAAGSPRVEIEI